MPLNIPPIPYDQPSTSFAWIDWYNRVRNLLNGVGINHNDLQNIQGGSSTERYHITQTQYNGLVGGNSTTLHKHDHNNMDSIQGGQATEYYHLTASQHQALTTDLEQTIELYAMPSYAIQLDQDPLDSSYAYLGQADPGSSTAAAAWRIQKLTFGVDGDLSSQWADGNSNFDNVWDNRASLSYS